MIRITRQTDYGIVLLTHLAAHSDRHHNAPELAAETRLPLPMVAKILKMLAKEGLLDSHRGVKGGYTLARLPEEISMAEIVTALEGPIALTECVVETGLCELEALCPSRSNWQVISRAVERALEGITLAEMSHPLPQKLVSLGRSPAAAAGSAETAAPNA